MPWPLRARGVLLLGALVLLLLAGPRSSLASEPKAPSIPGLRWVGVDAKERLRFDSAAGPLLLPKEAFTKRPSATWARLRQTVARAAAKGVVAPKDEPWIWQYAPPLGHHLYSGDRQRIVIPQAVLVRQRVPRRDSGRERTTVEHTATALRRAIRDTPDISPWMAGALDEVLAILHEKPGNPSKAELDPEFARRVVADPRFLSEVAGASDAEAREVVMKALTGARTLSIRTKFEGDGHVYTRHRDAWGTRAVVLRSPEAVLFSRVPPHPMDDGGRMKVLAGSRVVVTLPPKTDPIGDPAVLARLQDVRLVREGRTVVGWSPDGGIRGDDKAWREVFPPAEAPYLRDGFPRHIAMADASGNLFGVVVPKGLLRPVADLSGKEAQRFLRDAAAMLPTAAYLDLLQQYFLRYVWDSPDLTQPLMVGTEKYHDELHQTSEQILASCAGGVCRGDCDDVAEFIQDIAQRQGKLAHVLNLPGHLAAAWTERDGDKVRAYVLQSGPGKEFERDDVPSALEAAYLDLDKNAPFDRNNVSVSLRFAGQNTRSSYGLSWRIFADKPYADRMIDVQADWNRMTLLRAEQKMLAILAEGDTSTATYNELAALYDWMDRNKEAVRYDRLAVETRSDPESKILKTIELIDNLIHAGERDEAKALVNGILQLALPPLAEALGLRALVITLSLASTLADEAPELGMQVLHALTTQDVRPLGGSLHTLLAPNRNPELWQKHDEHEALQSFMEDYAWTAIAVLSEIEKPPAKPGPLTLVRAVLQSWLQKHAFEEVKDPEDLADRWTLLGRFLAIGNPKVLDTIEATPAAEAFPTGNLAVLARRGLTSEPRIVWRYTRATPWWFAYRISTILADEDTRPDPKEIQRLHRLMHEGESHARRLGWFGPDAESEMRRADLRVALVLKDADTLRRVFRQVQALGDRYAFESTSSALGWAAVHLDMDWWKQVIAIWVDEIDNPINYFNIVWRAHGMKAHDQALHVAEVAAQRYPKDAAIQQEAKLLRKLLAK